MKKLLQTKKTRVLIFCGLIALIAILIAGRALYLYVTSRDITPVTEEQLDSLSLADCTKLMIVAHPDDEALWGGAHLLEGGYLVVCITNGYNSTRAGEFAAAMEASGNVGMHLSYPDKVKGERSDWSEVRESIEADIRLILDYKDWELVITHNPDGEYGHIHHIMTNNIVTEIVDELLAENSFEGEFYYFGKYYKAVKIPDVEDTLVDVNTMLGADFPSKGDSGSDDSGTETLLERKEALLNLYTSQADTLEGLWHMVPYEMWVKASEWE